MFDYTRVPNSIVNTNSTAFNDAVYPYPYLTFITFFSHDTVTELKSMYNDYVNKWSSIKQTNTSLATITNNINQRYFDLLNSINLHYIDANEQRFLSNLQLDNEQDQDILLPFYINKINEITNYFIEKRENLKFTIQKNGNINSKKGIASLIRNFIIDELMHNSEYEALDAYTRDTMYNNLEIDIIEKYDTFSHYYDVDPDVAVSEYNIKDELFNKYFTNNVLDYDKISFIDKDSYLVQAIKAYPLYISQFGFSFSTYENGTDITKFKSSDFQDNVISSDYDKMNIHTYMDMTKKYAGADMYYVSADNTNTRFGKLFDAASANCNILNKKYTSIQNAPANEFVNKYNKGAFFLPKYQGISFYSAFNKEYNKKEIIPQGTYFFTDPEICGNIYGTSLTQFEKYPYTWSTDLNGLIYEKAYTNIQGQVNSNKYQDFHGYLPEVHTCTLNNNFESIANKGIIYSYKTDTYGNEYAIFKQKSLVVPDGANSAQYINSYNNIISSTFGNKNITDDIDELSKAGIMYTFDGGIISEASTLTNITPDVREWSPYINNQYFDVLNEGGIRSLTATVTAVSGLDKGKPLRPYIKVLDSDGKVVSSMDGQEAEFAENEDYNNIVGVCYDGGVFTGSNGELIISPELDTTFFTDIPYIDSTNLNGNYQTVSADIISSENSFNSVYEREIQPGEAFVRYNNSPTIVPIISALNFIPKIEEKQIQNIDVISDVIILTHKDGVIFNKIAINSNGELMKSTTMNREFTNDPINNKIKVTTSKYYYIESINAVIISQLYQDKNASLKDYDAPPLSILVDLYYPVITLVYLDDLHIEEIFRPTFQNIKDFILYSNKVPKTNTGLEYDISSLTNSIAYIEPATIIHNSLNNLYTLSYIIHDRLGYSHVVNMTFLYQQYKAYIMSNDLYMMNTNIYTTQSELTDADYINGVNISIIPSLTALTDNDDGIIKFENGYKGTEYDQLWSMSSTGEIISHSCMDGKTAFTVTPELADHVFWVEHTDDKYTFASNAVQLPVSDTKTIICSANTTLLNSHYTIGKDSTITISCISISDYENIKYQWFKNYSILPNKTQSYLQFNADTLDHVGVYYCVCYADNISATTNAIKITGSDYSNYIIEAWSTPSHVLIKKTNSENSIICNAYTPAITSANISYNWQASDDYNFYKFTIVNTTPTINSDFDKKFYRCSVSNAFITNVLTTPVYIYSPDAYSNNMSPVAINVDVNSSNISLTGYVHDYENDPITYNWFATTTFETDKLKDATDMTQVNSPNTLSSFDNIPLNDIFGSAIGGWFDIKLFDSSVAYDSSSSVITGVVSDFIPADDDSNKTVSITATHISAYKLPFKVTINNNVASINKYNFSVDECNALSYTSRLSSENDTSIDILSTCYTVTPLSSVYEKTMMNNLSNLVYKQIAGCDPVMKAEIDTTVTPELTTYVQEGYLRTSASAPASSLTAEQHIIYTDNVIGNKLAPITAYSSPNTSMWELGDGELQSSDDMYIVTPASTWPVTGMTLKKGNSNELVLFYSPTVTIGEYASDDVNNTVFNTTYTHELIETQPRTFRRARNIYKYDCNISCNFNCITDVELNSNHFTTIWYMDGKQLDVFTAIMPHNYLSNVYIVNTVISQNIAIRDESELVNPFKGKTVKCVIHLKNSSQTITIERILD